MKNRRIIWLLGQIVLAVAVLATTEFCRAQSGQSSGSSNPGQSNTTTTRASNPDGSTTVTTTTTYSDGSVTTQTTYDKDGHDAGTVRTDIQTKDGETTTTITKYDGNGHETGKTVTRVDKNGKTTVTNYDGNGNQTDTSNLPPFKPSKWDWKLGIDYKVPPEWRNWPELKSENKNSATAPPGQPGTARVVNPDGSTTITTVVIYKDGWTVTTTKYDKDGHDAGTTRTDVQTKDGQTTTTTTNWDGNGHEIGKTIEEVKADGSKTTITYDGNGHETGRTSESARQAKSQGLTPEDEKKIQKALNPDQTPTSTVPQAELPKADLESLRQALIKHAEKLNDEQSPAGLQTNQQPKQGAAPMIDSIVGVVTPTHRQKDKPFSGSITADPKQYRDIPGLQVLEVKLRLITGSDGKPTLRGLMLDCGNGVLQPADQPISFGGSCWQVQLNRNLEDNKSDVPGQPGPGALPPPRIILQSFDNSVPPMTLDLGDLFQHSPGGGGTQAGKPPVPSGAEDDVITVTTEHPLLDEKTINVGRPAITTNPICQPGHVTAVHGIGQFSGDAQRLLISFNGEPIEPIAASTDGFFFRIPAQGGSGQLVFADQGPNGWFAASTTIAVLKLQTGIANPNLHRGLRTTGTVGLSGGPQKMWSGANFQMTAPEQPMPKVTKIDALALKEQQRREQVQHPGYDPDLVNLADLQKQVPDFHPPEPGQPGFIFLSIQNRTPGIISIDGFKGNNRSWYLPADSLPFNTQLGIKAINDGGFDIGIIAQPLFPLMQMQQYQLPPELVNKLETMRLAVERKEIK